MGNSLRIPSPVSVAYTAPALIWFATRPALPRSADITVEARPGHRTGLCETQADIIFEAEIQEQSEPRFFVRLRYSSGRDFKSGRQDSGRETRAGIQEAEIFSRAKIFESSIGSPTVSFQIAQTDCAGRARGSGTVWCAVGLGDRGLLVAEVTHHKHRTKHLHQTACESSCTTNIHLMMITNQDRVHPKDSSMVSKRNKSRFRHRTHPKEPEE